MTREDDVQTIPDQEVVKPVSSDIPFWIASGIILRDETFGGTVTTKSSGTVYVDKQTLEILKTLSGCESFTADEVVAEFHVEAGPTREALARLEIQNLITKGGIAVWKRSQST